MSEVLIIVAVVAVLAVIVTVVFLRRRRPARAGGGEEPAAIEPPAGAGPAAREEARGEAAVPTRATGEAVTGAAEAEAVAAEPAAKPVPSEGELRSRVESQLTDSERMLGELREAAAAEGGEPALDAGSLKIMVEGLEEVRALARRKQWSQARDKCGALHAQLSLLLRSTRRGQSS